MPVFPQSQEVAWLVSSLSRWLSPPEPAERAAETEEDAPSAFESDCVRLDREGKTKFLAAKLRSALLARLVQCKEADARNAFGILLELLLQWQLLAAEAESLASELAALPQQQPELKCMLLLALFSVVQHHGVLEQRFTLLLTLIRFCAACDQLVKVLGPVEKRISCVERWVCEWELGRAEQKQLWAIVFDAHSDDDRVLYECALKYFALHDAADFASLEELRGRIVKALLVAVRSPNLFRCDELAQSAVVQQLEGDRTHAPLYRLLQIMARDTYYDFLAFAEQGENQAFMAEHELPVEACGDKMRLLTLVSLSQASMELSFETVADALHVKPFDVEKWVMRAIGAGLVTAKIDQARETVAVSMCAERDFGLQQWERLHTSLVDWRDAIHSLLDAMHKARPAA
jgi:translation initiation factor 3 subunit M